MDLLEPSPLEVEPGAGGGDEAVHTAHPGLLQGPVQLCRSIFEKVRYVGR